LQASPSVDLTTISTGTLLLAPEVTPLSDNVLVMNSGLVASAGTVTLARVFPIDSTILGTTTTTGDIGNASSSATLVSNLLTLTDFPAVSGTLNIDNVVNHYVTLTLAPTLESAGSIVLTGSNVLIPSSGVVESSGTLSLTTPEPTGLSLIAFAAL